MGRKEGWDMTGYEMWLRSIRRKDEPADLYGAAIQSIDELMEKKEKNQITEEDIHSFLRDLKRYEDERFFSLSGLYLSAILNRAASSSFHSSELYPWMREIRIDLRQLKKLLDFIGYRNDGGYIVVEGSVGNYAGCEMKGGILEVHGSAFGSVGMRMEHGDIVIKGNVGHWAGERMCGGSLAIMGDAKDALGVWMKGGEILVNGNAGNYVGRYMSGGRIVVEGNVGHWLGQFMRDGEIIVHGNAENGVGNWMRGGYISIGGEVGELLGLNMISGTICIKNMVITCVNRR